MTQARQREGVDCSTTKYRKAYRLDTFKYKSPATIFFAEGLAMAKRGKRKRFITQYRHWRSGKLMRAKDYGYKAWYF